MAHTIHYAHQKVLDEIQSWPAEMQADFAHLADVLAELGPKLRVPHTYAIGAGLYEVVAGGRGGDGRLVYGHAGSALLVVDAFRGSTRTHRESPRVTLALRRLQKARRAKQQPAGKYDTDYAPVPHDRAAFLANAAVLPGFTEAYAALAERYLIASTLVAARVQAGLTQAEVARRMATSASAVSRLETGSAEHSPSLATLRAYAAAVDADLQLTLVERPAPQP
jgi:phage-related protein/DNA-binding XRE family transcriptional regulator